MNYEGKTNRWIAVEVAKRIGKKVAPITDFYHGDGIVIYPHNNEINFDPCNNASDAWPIIVESRIGVMHNWHEKDFWSAVSPKSGSDFDCTDRNPLRAAMICFLKMRDSEQK